MTNFERALGRCTHRELRERDTHAQISASANRIDIILAVFAFGVILGTFIA